MSFKIPEEIFSVLNNWVLKLNTPLEEMIKEYKAIYEQIKEKYPNLTENRIHKETLKLLKVRLNKKYGSLRSSAKPYYGYILGSTEIKDRVQEMIDIAKRIYERDQERAILEGFTDASGRPLDFRKYFKGRENKRKGEPLEGRSEPYVQLFGVCHAGDFKWKPFVLTLEGELVSLQYPLRMYVMFRANGKETDDGYYRLWGSTATTFVKEQETEYTTLSRVIENLPVMSVTEFMQKSIGKKNMFVVTKGIVVSSGGLDNMNFYMEDLESSPDEKPVYVTYYEEVKVGSEILVIGYGRSYVGSDGENRYIIEAGAILILSEGLDIKIDNPIVMFD